MPLSSAAARWDAVGLWQWEDFDEAAPEVREEHRLLLNLDGSAQHWVEQDGLTYCKSGVSVRPSVVHHATPCVSVCVATRRLRWRDGAA